MNSDYDHFKNIQRFMDTDDITSISFIEDYQYGDANKEDYQYDNVYQYGGANPDVPTTNTPENMQKQYEDEFNMIFNKAKEYRERLKMKGGKRHNIQIDLDESADDYLDYGSLKSNIVTGGRADQSNYAMKDNTLPRDKLYARYGDAELMDYPYQGAYMAQSNDFTKANDAGPYDQFNRAVNNDFSVYNEIKYDEKPLDVRNTDTQQWTMFESNVEANQPGNDQSEADEIDWQYTVGDQLGGARRKKINKTSKTNKKSFNDDYYDLSSDDDKRKFSNRYSADDKKKKANPVLMKGIEIAKFLKDSGKYDGFKWMDYMKLTKIVVDEAKEGGSTDPEVYGKKAKEIALRDSDRIIKKFKKQQSEK